MAASALYRASVGHTRTRPRVHRLRYSVFTLLLDLGEIDALAARLRLFSRNRFNIFSFNDRDYGDGSATPLRQQITAHLAAADISIDGGTIRLLTMPRLLGYAFNPLSIYFCHRADNSLAAIVYEVNNTFGQRHSYLLPVPPGHSGPIAQSCAKAFYVSPFMDMAMTYDFHIREPGERLAIAITTSDAAGPMLTATMSGTRVALTDGALLRAFLVYPLMTLKVVAGIHWEALRIWLKGIALRPRPPAPASPVSLPPVRQLEEAIAP